MKKIIYDFDGTLTPYPIPKFPILKKCGYENGALTEEFIKEVKCRMNSENMDLYTAFYKTMFDKMIDNNLDIIDDSLVFGANNIEYNEGVINFLEHLYKNNINNYVLSSGLKVYLEKTKISPFIREFYGTTFIYDNNKIIDFDILMNDKKKVDGIKHILNSLEISDDNCYDLIYIGDGLTDLDAMKFVKDHGGITIFVYKNLEDVNLDEIKNNSIVDYCFKADYSKNSELSNFINNICGI